MTSYAHLDTSLDGDDQSDNRFSNSDVAPISDDWYHGHKVVAMPSSAFGGKTIREVVSSRNETLMASTSNSSNTLQRPRRSNSLGRTQFDRPGRDLVQDVYNRMGLSYTRDMDYTHDTTSNASSSNAAAAAMDNLPTNNNESGNHAGSPSMARGGGGRLSEKFSGRYRTAAAMVRTIPSTSTTTSSRGRNSDAMTGTNSSPRGRPVESRGDYLTGEEEGESEGQRRARSLSRGRSVKGSWPPTKHQQESTETVLATSESTTGLSSPKRSTPTVKRSHSFDARPQYGGGLRSSMNRSSAAIHNHNKLWNTTTTAGASTAVDTMKDEKKECDDRSVTSEPVDSGNSLKDDEDRDFGHHSIPSIKDRISVFAGSKKNTSAGKTPTSNNANTIKSYMKSAPPKVNIYEESRSMPYEQQQQQYPEEEVEPLPTEEEDEYSFQPQQNAQAVVTPPSAAAVAAAEEAYKYLRPSQMAAKNAAKAVATRHSTGSANYNARSSIAHSYLSGIQQVPPANSTANNTTKSNSRSYAGGAPVSEVFPHDEAVNPAMSQNNNNYLDSNSSVGASSCGDNDSSHHQKLNKKPSWRNYNTNSNNTNNQVKSSSSVASNSNNTSNNNTVTVSAEMVERMVDERVQSQLREVEARMETLLRRWMDQMNSKITSRLDAMESSIKDSMPTSSTSASWSHHEI